MKNRITLPVAFFLLLNFQLSALDYQTLTDVQGRSIQAHIWKVEGNEAFLEVPGGRKFRISTQVFSPQSQALLQQYANRVATPPAPPSPPPFGGSTPPPSPAFSTPSVASTPPAVSVSGALIESDVAIYPNAAVICKVDGARIAGSPFAQAIKAQMKPPGAPETPSDMPFGLTQDDVQSLAFSISSFDGLDFGKLSKSGPEALKELPPNVKFALAVTFSKPIDMATARQEIMEGSEAPVTFTEYAGATLVPMPQDAGVPQNYGAAIKNQGSGSIFLIGEIPHLRGVLDGSIPPGAASLAQEDISLAVNVPAALMDQLAATSQDNPLMAGLMVFLKQMNRITLGMSFNQAANINLAAHFADPAAAQQLSQMLAPMVASMTSKPDTPPFLKQLAITNNANQLNAALALQSQDAMGMLPMLMMGGAGAGEDFPEPDMVGSGPGFAPGVPGGPPQATSVPFSFDGNSTPGAPASPPPGSNPFGETSTPPPPPGSDPFGN